MRTKIVMTLAVFLIFSVLLWIVTEVNAMPGFARQTDKACLSCHFQHFPELNADGRAFKAEGYTSIGSQGKVEGADLSIPDTLNASVVAKIRYQMTNGKDDQATPINEKKIGTNKGELQFPDEAALFLGGRAGEHIGFLLEAELSDNTEPVFANFKMPIVFDVSGIKLSVIPFITADGGVAFGFELFNTGAIGMQRVFEHGRETTAQEFIGTTNADTAEAEGIALVAANAMGFINLSFWAPEHGSVDAGTNFSHYIRVAATPNIGIRGWDFGFGGQYWGGDTKISDAATVTKAWGIDAQAQGKVDRLPLGIYLSYGSANKAKNDGKTYQFNTFTDDGAGNCETGCNNKKAFSVLAELGVLPGKATVGVGYRKGDNGNAANNKDNSITVGATYQLAQNVQLQLNYSSFSGSAYDSIAGVPSVLADTLTTFMLFAAF